MSYKVSNMSILEKIDPIPIWYKMTDVMAS